MTEFPIFLSVVVVVRNQSAALESIVRAVLATVDPIVSDYEIVVVDNASDDESVAVLKGITAEDGQPNVQVYALSKEVDADTASWIGMESALGDFVAVVDPSLDDLGMLPRMLDHAVRGADVVFCENELKPPQSVPYRVAYSLFNRLYKWAGGIHLAKEAPQYRALSRRLVNFIMQHPHPAVTYRHLPARGGFARVHLTYRTAPRSPRRKRLADSMEIGMRLLVSTTRAPMRLVTALSLFGAFANLVYSAYVVAVAFLKADVAPGWVSLSLQQSGMFFLISLVLLVLGEYIVQMARLSNEGPGYHIGQEFTSARMTRRERLNVEAIAAPAEAVP